MSFAFESVLQQWEASCSDGIFQRQYTHQWTPNLYLVSMQICFLFVCFLYRCGNQFCFCFAFSIPTYFWEWFSLLILFYYIPLFYYISFPFFVKMYLWICIFFFILFCHLCTLAMLDAYSYFDVVCSLLFCESFYFNSYVVFVLFYHNQNNVGLFSPFISFHLPLTSFFFTISISTRSLFIP